TTNDISTTRLEKARATTPARWAWRLLRRVSTRLGDLAVLDRGRAGDADGSDNLAIRYEGNAAFERRGSAQRERAQGLKGSATSSLKAALSPKSAPDPTCLHSSRSTPG